MSARKKTETLDVTNWMSFIHHMYGAALHMGPYNYACIQLALEFWDYYAEVNFLRDQKHIIYFVAGAFRCNNKYAYRGGITHFSRKGQENAEYLMSSALKIESASYGLQMQPAITPIPFSKVKVDSWENRLAALAVDMILNPENEEYTDGYLLDPEEADASPLANMTLKIYLQILQRAINYEKKRKVIGQLSETKNEINEYIKEIRKETQEYFDEAKEEYTLMRIQLLQSKEDLIQFKNEADSMKQEINEVNDSIKQEINEAKTEFNILLEAKGEIKRIEDELGKKMGKKQLANLQKTIKEFLTTYEENLTNVQTNEELLLTNEENEELLLTNEENEELLLTNVLTSVLPLKHNLKKHYQFMSVCLEYHPEPIRQSTAYKRLGEDNHYFQHTIPELISAGLIVRQNKYYFNIPDNIIRKLSSNISTDVKQLSKNEGF